MMIIERILPCFAMFCHVLPCFAMFCQSFPCILMGFCNLKLPVASGRPIQTWSIQALNPELAKQQKLGNSATESSRYKAVHGSTGGFSSGYQRDSQVTDEENSRIFVFSDSRKKSRRTQTNHQPTGVWQPLLIEHSQS